MKTISGFEEIRIKGRNDLPYYIKFVLIGIVIAISLICFFYLGKFIILQIIKYWKYVIGGVVIIFILIKILRNKKRKKKFKNENSPR